MIVTWLLLRVWGSTQAEPNLCRWMCSPECSSVFGTAWWPQNIGPALTQQWRWLRSRHWFPGGSRAGSLPQQSEHRGEADRRRSGLLEGGIGTFLQLYNSFVLPAVTLCMFYVSMLTKCANSYSRRSRIWQPPVLDPTSVSEHCEQRIRNERAEIFIKTQPCSSSIEVSHSSFYLSLVSLQASLASHWTHARDPQEAQKPHEDGCDISHAASPSSIKG